MASMYFLYKTYAKALHAANTAARRKGVSYTIYVPLGPRLDGDYMVGPSSDAEKLREVGMIPVASIQHHRPPASRVIRWKEREEKEALDMPWPAETEGHLWDREGDGP